MQTIQMSLLSEHGLFNLSVVFSVSNPDLLTVGPDYHVIITQNVK